LEVGDADRKGSAFLCERQIAFSVILDPSGKYARALREQGYAIRVYDAAGTCIETRVLGEKTVVLEPDVWEYFPNSRAVNEALRALIAIAPHKQKVTSREEKTTYQVPAQKKNHPKA
jgi:hypothetical protein